MSTPILMTDHLGVFFFYWVSRVIIKLFSFCSGVSTLKGIDIHDLYVVNN